MFDERKLFLHTHFRAVIVITWNCDIFTSSYHTVGSQSVHAYIWQHIVLESMQSHWVTYLPPLPIRMHSRQLDTTDISIVSTALRSKRSSFRSTPLTFPPFTCIHITHAGNVPNSCKREKPGSFVPSAPSESGLLAWGCGKKQKTKDLIRSVHTQTFVIGSPGEGDLWLKRIQLNSGSLPSRNGHRERDRSARPPCVDCSIPPALSHP